MRRRILGACLLALVASRVAASPPVDDIRYNGWTKTTLAFLDRPPYFLSREDLLALPVEPPPLNSSPKTREELNEMLRLQAARTAEQQRSIEAHLEYSGVCAALMKITHRELSKAPKTKALLDHLERDAMFAVFHAKRRFNRARPHQLEPRLKPCIPVPAHAAYPSGHAMQGYVVGRALSLLSPGDQNGLMAQGILIGREREIAGLHFPSDSAASRALGEALFARLAKNEKFLREVEAAKSEWR